MKKEFSGYMKDIGVSDAMASIIEFKYEQAKGLLNVSDFDDMYISEGSSIDGNRQYFDVYFFKGGFLINGPITKTDFNVKRIDSKLMSYEMSKCNFNLNQPIPANARLTIITRRYHGAGEMLFNSSGMVNCTHLLNLVKKYFIPNLI